MKIILKQNISNLGEKGDIVEVKDGYARNYLIPQGMALPHNKKTERMINNLIDHESQKIRREEEEYQEKLDAVKGIKLNVQQKAGEDQKLFGTVTTQDISDVIKEEKDVEIDKKYIVLDQHISTLGEYDVKVKFAKGFEANFSIVVNSEEGSKESEKENKETEKPENNKKEKNQKEDKEEIKEENSEEK